MTLDTASTPGSTEPLSPLPWGVNVAGFLRGGLGLGEAARLYVSALQNADVPVRTTTVDVPLPESAGAAGAAPVRKVAEFSDLSTDVDCPVNLICVNAPELPRFYNEVGASFFAGRHSIGVWGWEVDKVPDDWSWSLQAIDELWAYSDYVADIFRRVADVPVVRVPLPVSTPTLAETPVDLGLPDRFTFLFLFDFFSTMQRKNPLGLITAFRRAFDPGEGPQLLIKSFNGDYKRDRLARLNAAAGGHPDVHVVDRYLTLPEKNRLVADCHCYVSLHRAEGFGLTMAEAMALERPVIATGFSGNLDFMTEENSYLVDWVKTQVGPEGENYPADGTWAEPNLDHAAKLMREVWENSDGARARAERGRADVAERLSAAAVGEVARGRLGQLEETFARTSPPPPPPPLSLIGGPVRAAEWKLAFDPARDARERGGPKGFAQAAALRAMRPYTYHQDELNAALVEGLRDATDEIDRMRAFFEHAHLDTQAAIDLGRMIAGFRARPASAHPLISFEDETGRRALGFTAAGERGPDGYAGFEDIFRGDERQVRAAQQRYVELVRDAGWVLDLGCGRGEFLDLLRERDVRARGIDLDEGMVARCRQKGHEVAQGDAIEHLAGLEDGSVPAVFAAQVIEHLPHEQLTRLLSLLTAKLVPGGMAILETVNPHSASALKAFWTDVTHQHPLFPEVVLGLCRLAGFESGRVLLSDETGNFDADIHTSADYAVVATARRA